MTRNPTHYCPTCHHKSYLDGEDIITDGAICAGCGNDMKPIKEGLRPFLKQ